MPGALGSFQSRPPRHRRPCSWSSPSPLRGSALSRAASPCWTSGPMLGVSILSIARTRMLWRTRSAVGVVQRKRATMSRTSSRRTLTSKTRCGSSQCRSRIQSCRTKTHGIPLKIHPVPLSRALFVKSSWMSHPKLPCGAWRRTRRTYYPKSLAPKSERTTRTATSGGSCVSRFLRLCQAQRCHRTRHLATPPRRPTLGGNLMRTLPQRLSRWRQSARRHCWAALRRSWS
mmetsp:Transcript_173799/g.556995  ORF Transcript_173799/g.556995 Transcript_173799/m.556995 type:complete len:230 (-) Transcript_173799:1488-2177(-)